MSRRRAYTCAGLPSWRGCVGLPRKNHSTVRLRPVGGRCLHSTFILRRLIQTRFILFFPQFHSLAHFAVSTRSPPRRIGCSRPIPIPPHRCPLTKSPPRRIACSRPIPIPQDRWSIRIFQNDNRIYGKFAYSSPLIDVVFAAVRFGVSHSFINPSAALKSISLSSRVSKEFGFTFLSLTQLSKTV